jgi:membrane-bound lytic murein transglycosylase
LEGAEMCVNMEKAKRVLEEHGDEVDVVLDQNCSFLF